MCVCVCVIVQENIETLGSGDHKHVTRVLSKINLGWMFNELKHISKYEEGWIDEKTSGAPDQRAFSQR